MQLNLKCCLAHKTPPKFVLCKEGFPPIYPHTYIEINQLIAKLSQAQTEASVLAEISFNFDFTHPQRRKALYKE